MQPSPMASPAIDAQQEQHQQQLMMMPLPSQAGSFPQQPQPQLTVQQYPQQVFLPLQPEPQLMAQQYPQQVSSADEIRTLWIGGLQHWMDETYLHDCFSYTEDLLSLKIIRNKQTGESEGYGFLEFASHAAAQMALQNYNGEQFYRLNWATFGSRQKRPEDYTIFVGDLAYDVTDDLLQETFRAIYPSVKGAKVITDTATGRSKGYGFVDFGNANEQLRAMTEMNGMLCSSRPMRIGPAVTKKNTVYQQPYPKVVASASDNDSNNTTLFVAGLDPTVTVEMLTQSFVQFGELVHVKIPVGKRFGFVQFSNRASAEVALQKLHGTVLGHQPIRLSWGRNPANKQVQRGGWLQIQQHDPNQWNGDVQGYNAGYGYVTEPQDPNMYSYTAPNANYYHQQDPNQWKGDAQGYNADYGYVTQSQDLNMYSYTAPNPNYQQQDPNYQQQDPNMYSYNPPNANYQQQ